MLLVIEQGNTNTLLALRSADSWVAERRISTRRTSAATSRAMLTSMLASLPHGGAKPELEGCVISSVVPSGLAALRALTAQIGCETAIVGEDLPLKAPVRLSYPDKVGADRLLNAIGGFATYGGPLLIVASGTVVKFDVVGPDGALEGGAFFPGLWSVANLLVERCALLNGVAIGEAPKGIGRDTDDALLSGLYFGHLSLLEGMIARMVESAPLRPTVVATGGVMNLFAGRVRGVDRYDPALTLNGLVEAWRTRK
jgi:type III pantothenate kinase